MYRIHRAVKGEKPSMTCVWAWGLSKQAACGAVTEMENAWVESMTQAEFSLWGGVGSGTRVLLCLRDL